MLMDFLQMRIGDPRLLSLVKRILVAGVVEDGRLMPTEKGVPQGGPTSAVLANVYLHHVLDTWFMEVVKAHCEGEAHLVRYADDFVGCFQYERDARRFYESLVKRLDKFNLEIAVERPASSRSEGTPPTSGGRTDWASPIRSTFWDSPTTVGKAPRDGSASSEDQREEIQGLARTTKEWLRRNLTTPAAEVIRMLVAKLRDTTNTTG